MMACASAGGLYVANTGRLSHGLGVMHRRLTAIVERDGDGYVARCPAVDIASQGRNVAEARELFLETAPRGGSRPAPAW